MESRPRWLTSGGRSPLPAVPTLRLAGVSGDRVLPGPSDLGSDSASAFRTFSTSWDRARRSVSRSRTRELLARNGRSTGSQNGVTMALTASTSMLRPSQRAHPEARTPRRRKS